MKSAAIFLSTALLLCSFNWARSAPPEVHPKFRLVAKCEYLLSNTLTPIREKTGSLHVIGLTYKHQKGATHSDIQSAMDFTSIGQNSYRFKVNSPKREVFFLTLNKLERADITYLSSLHSQELTDKIFEIDHEEGNAGVYALTLIRTENEQPLNYEASIKTSGSTRETVYITLSEQGDLTVWKLKGADGSVETLESSDGTFSFSMDYKLKFGRFEKRDAQLIVNVEHPKQLMTQALKHKPRPLDQVTLDELVRRFKEENRSKYDESIDFKSVTVDPPQSAPKKKRAKFVTDSKIDSAIKNPGVQKETLRYFEFSSGLFKDGLITFDEYREFIKSIGTETFVNPVTLRLSELEKTDPNARETNGELVFHEKSLSEIQKLGKFDLDLLEDKLNHHLIVIQATGDLASKILRLPWKLSQRRTLSGAIRARIDGKDADQRFKVTFESTTDEEKRLISAFYPELEKEFNSGNIDFEQLWNQLMNADAHVYLDDTFDLGSEEKFVEILNRRGVKRQYISQYIEGQYQGEPIINPLLLQLSHGKYKNMSFLPKDANILPRLMHDIMSIEAMLYAGKVNYTKILNRLN